MNTQPQVSANVAAKSQSLASRTAQITMAAVLGLFVVGGVGFSHMEVVHNAAHDYRHSTGFPCH